MTRRVVVVGGGIAGLAAAHRLLREPGVEVRVLEAGAAPGGALATERVDGCLLERGPDCWLATKPAGIELCRALGLEAALIGTVPENRKSFVVHRGRLHPVPEGFYLMAPGSLRTLARSGLFSWCGRFRMAMDLLIPARRGGGDESLAAFVRRRLGREALERLAQPMIAGITTADPEMLSMSASMPQFLEMEREHGSLIRAMSRRKPAAGTSGPRYGMFASLAGGMGQLVDALSGALGESLRCGTRATVARRDGGGWTVGTGAGEVAADALIVALPAPAASRLLAAEHPALAERLAAIRFASVVTAHLAWREADAPLPAAMGFVVPAVEDRTTVAASFTSRKFPGRAPAGISLIRVFAGGALRPGVAALPDDALLDGLRGDLRDLLGIGAAPLFARVNRHAEAMPQYDVGHLARVAEIERLAAERPGLALAGASYRGVGMPDCVAGGIAAAEQILASPPA